MITFENFHNNTDSLNEELFNNSKPSDFYFALKSCDSTVTVVITPKLTYDKYDCLWSQKYGQDNCYTDHLLPEAKRVELWQLPSSEGDFEAQNEYAYQYEDAEYKHIKADLISRGFHYNNDIWYEFFKDKHEECGDEFLNDHENDDEDESEGGGLIIVSGAKILGGHSDEDEDDDCGGDCDQDDCDGDCEDCDSGCNGSCSEESSSEESEDCCSKGCCSKDTEDEPEQPTEDDIFDQKFSDLIKEIKECKTEDDKALVRNKICGIIAEKHSINMDDVLSLVTDYVKNNAETLSEQLSYIVPDNDWSKCLDKHDGKVEYLKTELSKPEKWRIYMYKNSDIKNVNTIMFKPHDVETPDEFFGYVFVSKTGEIRHVFASSD